MVATQKGDPPKLTAVQCLTITQQIARGMDHISTSRIIHKDLAARNCVVTSKLVTKVGLARLTREPYSQEYCKHMNQVNSLIQYFSKYICTTDEIASCGNSF